LRFDVSTKELRGYDNFKKLEGFWKKLGGITQKDEFHLAKGADVEWVMPGGVTVKQRVTAVSFSFVDNVLRRFDSHGQLMPVTEAYEVAKKLMDYAEIQSTSLEPWFEAAQKSHWNTSDFTIGTKGKYPVVHLRIGHSYNTFYPTVLVFTAYFDGNRRYGVNPDNPLPWTTTGTLSLNPPSGKFYTREEAYRPLKEKWEKEHPPLAVMEQAKQVTLERAVTGKPQSYWVALLLPLLILIAIFIYVRRKK
jgi:hypothetical protein